MGDLRNKFRELEEEARIQAMQRRMERQSPSTPELRCLCGLTYHQVDVLWAVQADRWSAVQFYCPAGQPDEVSGVAAR